MGRDPGSGTLGDGAAVAGAATAASITSNTVPDATGATDHACRRLSAVRRVSFRASLLKRHRCYAQSATTVIHLSA
jgi:hypothetical protein